MNNTQYGYKGNINDKIVSSKNHCEGSIINLKESKFIT